jgi:hypothetical protein
LECDALDALIWYSDQDEAGSAGAERKKMLAARQGLPGLSARHHLAHLQGSDAHSMKAFERHDPSKPWTRVKLAEPSFNALRVAMIDPAARVRAAASVSRPQTKACTAPARSPQLPNSISRRLNLLHVLPAWPSIVSTYHRSGPCRMFSQRQIEFPYARGYRGPALRAKNKNRTKVPVPKTDSGPQSPASCVVPM